ncbi:conserved hypothetical protein [Halobacteriovorax marinus SJ]|uniref:Uncharacterized protein n=1 Tax=Halobacteriovorax marinus (strain ATCC BAA-682 / DSM 15412 / SJ) TaxID=862908 RepID=E1WZE6_HALMS|nr:hypothetical protein [Halobacteriovorax marinus]CBW27834.1 conserved hypothetical protein [Halobacteriovorax marinus SJ]
MSSSSIESLKIKAKLLQKAKKSKGEDIALKEAFKIIAKTAGYENWKALKDSYELADLVNPPRWASQWKKWFSTIEEARKFATPTEYILPYRKQFFVCDDNYLRELGLDSSSTELLELGREWTDDLTRERLKRLLS